MCIIAIKPLGVQIPDNETIENMWYNNPDGAGFMYPRDGMVQIKKGYMTLKHFKKALKSLKKEIDIINTPIVFHFRIGTSGGNTPENTHPFPVTEHLSVLQKLQCKSPLAVAHNGIIQIETSREDISDTMEYIISQLGPLYQLKKDFYRCEAGKRLIYNFIQSKMVFLDGQGRVETIGKFIENDGILYSNFSYLPYYNYKNWDIWDNYLLKYGQKKPLCWIYDDGYVINEKGELIDGYDFLIDRSGDVYEYDWEFDICRKINAKAYTFQNLPYQFNEDTAEIMEVDI